MRGWAEATRGPDGRPVADQPDVRRALAETGASLRINELLNWQVAVADTVEIADASATKVFSSERIQRLGQLLADVVGRHGDPADGPTAELMTWLDVQGKRNLVLTFGGGVNEVQRELIATAGLRLPQGAALKMPVLASPAGSASETLLCDGAMRWGANAGR